MFPDDETKVAQTMMNLFAQVIADSQRRSMMTPAEIKDFIIDHLNGMHAAGALSEDYPAGNVLTAGQNYFNAAGWPEVAAQFGLVEGCDGFAAWPINPATDC